MKRALVSWSGGKDAAWSLHRLRGAFEIAALLTTVSEADGSVPVHEIPGSLLDEQADSLGLPIWKADLPQPCTNSAYGERLSPLWQRAVRENIEVVVFGDLFLSDIRAWREHLLSDTKLSPLFPLWGENTARLSQEMITGGLAATVCALDNGRVPDERRGTAFDAEFLSRLPRDVDPCGENGEFHTFVTNMPGFRRPVKPCPELFR